MKKAALNVLITALLTFFELNLTYANAVTLDFEDGTAQIPGNPSTFFLVENTADIVFQNAVYITAPSGEPDFVEFGTLGMSQDPFSAGPVILDFARPVTQVSLDVVVIGNHGVRLSPLDFQFLPGPPSTIDFFRVGEDVQFAAPNNPMPPQV